ncbi:hypothetical protein R3P38DRAFT_3280150 [Favolaschia claudopus]|uniref:Uncharacterized protein n=1 Tax=Favolaschia claudopus TaxID=2862362 RepID=A0AAW0AH99_9AGAR
MSALPFSIEVLLLALYFLWTIAEYWKNQRARRILSPSQSPVDLPQDVPSTAIQLHPPLPSPTIIPRRAPVSSSPNSQFLSPRQRQIAQRRLSYEWSSPPSTFSAYNSPVSIGSEACRPPSAASSVKNSPRSPVLSTNASVDFAARLHAGPPRSSPIGLLRSPSTNPLRRIRTPEAPAQAARIAPNSPVGPFEEFRHLARSPLTPAKYPTGRATPQSLHSPGRLFRERRRDGSTSPNSPLLALVDGVPTSRLHTICCDDLSSPSIPSQVPIPPWLSSTLLPSLTINDTKSGPQKHPKRRAPSFPSSKRPPDVTDSSRMKRHSLIFPPSTFGPRPSIACVAPSTLKEASYTNPRTHQVAERLPLVPAVNVHNTPPSARQINPLHSSTPKHLSAFLSPTKVPKRRVVEHGSNPVYYYEPATPATVIAETIARPVQTDFKEFSAMLSGKFQEKGWVMAGMAGPDKKKNKKRKKSDAVRVFPKPYVQRFTPPPPDFKSGSLELVKRPTQDFLPSKLTTST